MKHIDVVWLFQTDPKEKMVQQRRQVPHVAFPKKGLHDWVGSMDLNSPYPSVFRALNMGPETIVGQLRMDYTDKEIKDKMTQRKKSLQIPWLGKFGTNEYELVMSQDVTHPSC